MKIKPAIDLNVLDQMCLFLLEDEEFGLKVAVSDSEEAELINATIQLIHSDHQRDDWTALKHKALLLVGSPIADVISRIASAQRNPDIALSGLRDACEKAMDIAANMARQKLALTLRKHLRDFSQQQSQA